MVLGIVTGSMPMLVSLLLMQGITLTMWRSFLDKAIPRYNSEKWRKNLDQVIHSGGDSAHSMRPSEQQSVFDNQKILSSASTFDQPQIDPVTNSLQILANLDPKIIQLFNQLKNPEQSNNNENNKNKNNDDINKSSQLSLSSDQLNNLNFLVNLIQSLPNAGRIQLGKEKKPQPYMQYIQMEPQDRIKYFEVSSAQVNSEGNNENENQMVDYEKSPGISEEDNENTDVKYEFVQDSNSKTREKKPKIIDSNNLYEEVDYENEENQDEQEEEDNEETDENGGLEEEEEEQGNYQRKLTIRERFLPKKIFSTNKNIRQKLKESSMFGRPRINKRMLKLDTNRFQYAQSKLKKKIVNSFRSFPLLRGKSKKKQSSSSWKRTSNPSKGNFRFVTPKVPIILSTTNNSDSDLKEISNTKNLKPIKLPLTKNVANQKKILKLKSNKITLRDIEEVENNCTIDNAKSKKQFKEIWSQKNGWNKCHPKSPNFRISKGIVIPNIELDQSTVVTLVPNEPNIEELTTELQSQAKGTTSEEISTTTLSSTTVSVSDSLLINFNNFLMSLTTNTTLPSLVTSTTTTTIAPLNTTRNYIDELPKELLLHILNVINSSKIDNFQMNDLSNYPKSFNSQEHDEKQAQFDSASKSFHQEENEKKNEENQDEENENEDENEEEENQSGNDYLDWNTEDWSQINDNPVDGKILVAHRFKRVCYYLLNGGKDGQLDINQLELHVCSHLIVGYARISTNGLVVAQKPLEDTEKYRRSTLMKLQYPKLKVLLSIGDLGGAMFSIVASNNRTRERFIQSALDICDEFNFDGIDIDWEFPGFRTPGSLRDKYNLILLLKEFRLKSNQFWKNKIKIRDQFMISLAVGAPLMIASTSYIIPDIGKFVDFVNLMSYDFHYYRTDKPYTGHHSPLYPRSTDNAYFSTLNAWTATYWANKGMPLRKIIVGVPFYARTYNLVVPIGQNMINVPASGPGIGKGKLNYTQVCEFLKLPETMKQYDFHSQVPYAYRGFDWIAYENEMSVAIKAQWVVKTGMGGIVTFALNFDDAKGTCREDGKRFPLQKTISNVLELASIESYKQSLYVAKVRSSRR